MNEPRGLLVPAWTGGQNYHGAKVVFIEDSPFAGKTLCEVSEKTGIPVPKLRDAALRGICPTTIKKRGEAG